MSLEHLMEATREDLELFSEMMDYTAGFETMHPDVHWDKMLRLHDSFVVCEPNQQRWGRWGLWKCGCDGCFADGLCGHSLLLSFRLSTRQRNCQVARAQVVAPIRGPMLGVRRGRGTRKIQV